MLYNIIGDVHGREKALELIDSSAINIFVGDYFSPYHPIPWETQLKVFLAIIDYKKQHPETVLLIGNHDYDYIYSYDYGVSRHDSLHAKEIKDLFEQNKDLFQLAYSINNQILITHAGLSIIWYLNYKNFKDYTYSLINFKDTLSLEENLKEVDLPEKYKSYYVFYYKKKYYILEENNFIPIDINPNNAAEFINNIYKENPKAFSFSANDNGFDCYGANPMHGPTWFRTDHFSNYNAFKGTNYKQIFGHTISYSIHYCPNKKDYQWAMIDCLEGKKESLKIEI